MMPNSLTQSDIGKRIRQARERIQMSQRDFAQAVGKDQKAISEYESGTRRISAVELANFAQVLKVPVAYFLPVDIETDDLDQSLLQAFHTLPTAQDKQDAISIVRSLVSVALRRLP
jgi:transcriptional regulator with XRE-family HTH domain